SIRVQEAAASVVLNKPLVVPAYTVPGFMGSATRLLTPSAIAASNFSFGMRPLLTFSQCAVPSVVLYTTPVVPAYITSGLCGSIASVTSRGHGVPQGARQYVRRAVGVHPQGEDAKAAQVRGHFAPGGSAVAGLVQRFVGGHVEDVGVPRMRRDRHDGVTLLSTGRDRKQEAAQHPGAQRKGHGGLFRDASASTLHYGTHGGVSSVPLWLTAAVA